MSASRACFAFLRSGPADPRAWQVLVRVGLGAGFAFPACYLDDDRPARFAAERSNRRDQSVAQLFGHIGHLERLDGSGDRPPQRRRESGRHTSARFWRSSRQPSEAARGFPAFCGRCRATRARSERRRRHRLPLSQRTHSSGYRKDRARRPSAALRPRRARCRRWAPRSYRIFRTLRHQGVSRRSSAKCDRVGRCLRPCRNPACRRRAPFCLERCGSFWPSPPASAMNKAVCRSCSSHSMIVSAGSPSRPRAADLLIVAFD